MAEIEVQTFSIDKLHSILENFLNMVVALREVQQTQQQEIELVVEQLKLLSKEISCLKNQ